jgi:hypothetical protein
MKKILFLVATLGLVTFASCGGDDKPTETPKVTVSAIPEAPMDGEATVSFTVNSNADWEITAAEDWYSLDVKSGGSGNTTITVDVEANEGAARSSDITVTPKGGTAQIAKLTQAGLAIETTVPNAIEGAGGEATFDITSPLAWTIAEPTEDWLTVTPMEGEGGTTTVTVTAEVNPGALRSGSIVITAGTLTATVAVNQKATEVTVPFNYADLLGLYDTTGTVSGLMNTPGPTDFVLEVVSPGNGDESYVGVFGWGENSNDLPFFVDVVGESLFVDIVSPVVEAGADGEPVRFQPFYIGSDKMLWLVEEAPEVIWNGALKTLDFTLSEVDGNKVFLGFLGFVDNGDGTATVNLYGENYGDAFATQTSASSAPIRSINTSAVGLNVLATYQMATK